MATQITQLEDEVGRRAFDGPGGFFLMQDIKEKLGFISRDFKADMLSCSQV